MFAIEISYVKVAKTTLPSLHKISLLKLATSLSKDQIVICLVNACKTILEIYSAVMSIIERMQIVISVERNLHDDVVSWSHIADESDTVA